MCKGHLSYPGLEELVTVSFHIILKDSKDNNINMCYHAIIYSF